MKLYRIRDWNTLFENNRSRIVARLDWVPVPNRHDGEGYLRVIGHKHGSDVFAAWILMLQVASRCSPRGSLSKSNGTPLDAETLSLRTRAPKVWFERAFEVLTDPDIGWLEVTEVSDIKDIATARHPDDIVAAPACHPAVTQVTAACHPDDTPMTPACQPPDSTVSQTAVNERKKEGNGIEGREGTEGVCPAEAGPHPVEKETEEQKFMRKLQADPANAGLDVALEFLKMSQWCRVNNCQPTNKRFINWLNKCPRPMSSAAAANLPKQKNPHLSDGTEASWPKQL